MGGWSTPHSKHLTPRKKTQYPGRAPGLALTGVENLTLVGIRSPDLQPVAHHYTNSAILDHLIDMGYINN
jgi:hypothetical protein